jgi:hypothetical protein
MNLAMLRVEGADEAIHRVQDTLALVPDSAWKRGDAKRHGGFFANSGLSATIADAKNPGEMVVAIREFVAMCKARHIDFVGAGVSAELSIGVTVGDAEQFVASICFSVADLLSLGALGVELSISAYPTSDEANDTNQDA